MEKGFLGNEVPGVSLQSKDDLGKKWQMITKKKQPRRERSDG